MTQTEPVPGSVLGELQVGDRVKGRMTGNEGTIVKVLGNGLYSAEPDDQRRAMWSSSMPRDRFVFLSRPKLKTPGVGARCKKGDLQVGDLVRGFFSNRPGVVEAVNDDHDKTVKVRATDGKSPHDGGGHPYIWGADATPGNFAFVDRPEKKETTTVAKQVKLKGGQEKAIYTVLAEDGNQYWLKGSGGRFTDDKTSYEEFKPVPEVGDIWAYPWAPDQEFVILGVDEKNQRLTMARKKELTGYDALTGPVPKQERAVLLVGGSRLYVRPLPEEKLELVERPS